MWLLQLVGMLAFLFGLYYSVAAMGNHRRYKHYQENDLGSAIMLFIPVVLYRVFQAISDVDQPSAFAAERVQAVSMTPATSSDASDFQSVDRQSRRQWQ
jgi:hypothetical protein